jgi:hypothetical protein
MTASSKKSDRAREATSGPPPGELRRNVICVAASGMAMAVMTYVGFGWVPAVGVAVGTLLATLNLIVFIRLARAFLHREGSSAPWAILGGIKLLGLFACVFVILRRGDVSPLALAVGYGSLPLGITLATLWKPEAPKG